jgi:hypothetical protein
VLADDFILNLGGYVGVGGGEGRLQIDGHEFILCGIFFGVVVCAFCWGFGGNGGLDVVFFWTECGGLGGEGGLLEDGILVGNFLQFLGIYFWDFHLADGGTRVASLPLKRQIQGFFASLRMTT